MIKAEKMSFAFPQKELYTKISFTLDTNQHCALIGSNGTGKSTLIQIFQDPENYTYEGRLRIQKNCRIAYVSQFPHTDMADEVTVYDYLCEAFLALQAKIDRICDEMGTAENLEPLMEEYQKLLDASEAMDADHYDSTIKKQLKTAGLSAQEKLPMGKLSGGEYKLVQILKEMLVLPDLLIMDEPDGFLDFENLNALKGLINSYQGTLLVITHNRYLLNHCFDKILHLENGDIQEFDGNYVDYQYTLLQTKIEMQELSARDEAEIERNQKVVERLRADATRIDDPSKGRTLHAKVSLLERLEARRIKAPFINLKQPVISLVTTRPLQSESVIVKLENYSAKFDEQLLEDVNFLIQAKDKVAIVGPNGTGKTTMLRDIYHDMNPAIELAAGVEMGVLSQNQGDVLNEEHRVLEEFQELGFEREEQVKEYLEEYCLEEDVLNSKIGVLSGGEKNLLQLAKLSVGNANLLLLDEPTSHLDIYGQEALERAIHAYNGAVLMVSHDFYTIANTMDYVLFIEDGTVRKMSIRTFRKMIYAKHFDKDYLLLEEKKKELELRIENALKAKNIDQAKKLCEELGDVIKKMK